PQASMFVANTPERVFLPNANIEQPKVKEHYDMFGLTDVQMNTIKNLIPKKQYYIQTPDGSGAVDLDLMPMSLAFIGNMSDLKIPARQQKEEEIKSEYGKKWPFAGIRFLAMPDEAVMLESNSANTRP